jgi:peptidoglycan/LPS O-acetylase OafA/YrhL
MSRAVLRSTAAIVGGLASIITLTILTDLILEGTHIIPHGPLNDTKLQILELAYRGLYFVIGGYVAARIASVNRRKVAGIVGGINCLLGIVGAIATYSKDLAPMWYALALVIAAIPLAWLGGVIATNANSHIQAQSEK